MSKRQTVFLLLTILAFFFLLAFLKINQERAEQQKEEQVNMPVPQSLIESLSAPGPSTLSPEEQGEIIQSTSAPE